MSKEEMREGFEAWHCEQYKTHGMTGAPTRDMHNGVYSEKYCLPKQQALWECWQETGGDVAKVEALKDEIELIEAGKQPVAVLYKDGAVLTKEECGIAFDVCCKVETPLFTRSDAGEVERLREELESTKAALREEMKDAFEFQQKNAALIELLRETSDYLDGSTRNSVWCDSILHKKMKAAIQPAESGVIA